VPYVLNDDLAAHEARVAEYERARTQHDEQVAAIDAQYAEQYAAWQAEMNAIQAAQVQQLATYYQQTDAPPLTAPPPTATPPAPPPEPIYPPAPVAPDFTAPMYEAREVTEPEELAVPGGVALVLPPRVVLSANGVSFAISHDELAAAYTTEVLT